MLKIWLCFINYLLYPFFYDIYSFIYEQFFYILELHIRRNLQKIEMPLIKNNTYLNQFLVFSI